MSLSNDAYFHKQGVIEIEIIGCKMEERRKSKRFTINLKAQYSQEERKGKGREGKGKECTVINISRTGAGLELYTSEKIIVGTTLFFEMFAPEVIGPTKVEGIVRWVKQGKKDFIGGIEVTSKSDKDKLEDLIMFTLAL